MVDSSKRFGAEPSSSFTPIGSRRAAATARSVFTDWHGNCFNRPQKEKLMKTKANVKAGAAKGNVAAGWNVTQGAAA